MKNNTLKKMLLGSFAAICFVTLFSGCIFSLRERQQVILAQMEIVEVDHRGYVRYEGDIIKPGEFANRFRARKEQVAGKPVLLSINPEVNTNQPEVVPYLRRVIESVDAGAIYTKVPTKL